MAALDRGFSGVPRAESIPDHSCRDHGSGRPHTHCSHETDYELATTEQTIEAIARDVGYQNPFVFSNAFRKWIGWRPSDYRRKTG
jgi:hypothetical protein